MNARFFIVLPALMALLLTGCAAMQRAQYHEVPLSEEQALLSRVFRTDVTETLRGIALFSLEQPSGGRHSHRLAMAVSHPSDLRLESLPSFGIPAFFLSLSSGAFKVYVPGNNRFYIGAATKDNLHSFLNIPLSPEEIPSLLTGTPPIKPSAEEGQHLGMYRSDRGEYRIDLRSRDGALLQSLRVNNDHDMTGLEVFGEKGRRRYEASFSRQRCTGTSSYPEHISVKIGEFLPTIFTVDLSDTVVTRGEGPSFFDLSAPPGVEIIYMD